MNHLINFETTVDLPRVTNVYNLNYKIEDYNLKDVLEGRIVLYGKYVKDNLEEIQDYEEEVDFTVDFDSEKYSVSGIECEKLRYEVIFGRGINVYFDVRIDYEQSDLETEFIKDKVSEETDDLLEEVLKDRDDTFLDDEVEDEMEEIVVEIEEVEKDVVEIREIKEDVVEIKEVEEDEVEIKEVEEVVVEIKEVEEDVVEMERLGEIEIKDDLKEESKIEINKITIRENDEGFLGNLQETYSTYKVIYNVDEQNVEDLARKYNKSVEEIYKDNNYSINKNLLIKDDSKK